jgi:hypothetical protein
MRRYPDDRIPAGDAPERGDGQRDGDEPQRPDAGLVGDLGKRIGAEVASDAAPDEQCKWNQCGGKDEGLQ